MGRLKQIFPIITSIVLTFGVVWIFKPSAQIDSNYYRNEFKQEVEQLRTEIKETVLKELIQRYENIDSITTTDGVNTYVIDFRKRTGDRLPHDRQR